MATTILVLVCLVAAVSCQTDGPVVQVDQGPIQGVLMTSRHGRPYSAFQGIPYAQPPVGSLRFKEPVPAKPWKGVWNASVPGSMCLQWVRIHPPNYGVQSHLIGDEDCLFLNVYTPKLPAGGTPPNLEVFVYIHGGAFMYGWGHEYGAKIMMDQDAVLVTINYRVGPLGFLTTGDDVVPGNNGLKDQATALKWVKSNIGAFGGNPNSITISGTSAGGASVSYHYLSPWSRGLFNRGISQSGSSFCGWAQMEEGVAKARRLGALLGCHGSSSKELVDCLRTRPARKIVQQVEHFIVWMYNPYSPFAPTIEKTGPNPFLNKHPVDVILGNEAYDVPWMASATLEDGLYPAADWVGNETTLETLDRRFVELSPHIFHYNFTVADDRKQEVVDRLREHYLRCRPITSKTIKEVIEMCTDRLFLLPVARTAKLLAAVNKSPVYFYMFGYRGKHSFSDVMSGTTHNFGVSHLDDTGYLMDYDFKTDETDEDQEMSKVLLNIWMSYAKTGKPVPAGRNFEWRPTEPNKKDLSYLQIMSPTEMEMLKSDDIGNQKFWDSLPISEPQMRKTTPLKGNTEMVHINISSIFRRRSETNQSLEKDDKRETRPQVALAVQHFLINIGLGMSMGHSAVLLPQLKEEAESGLQVDEDTGSWIASVYMLVSPLGCFLGGVLLEKIGRRSGVLLGQGVYIVGWTVIAAAQNSTMMICGRILDGIAVGIIGSAAAILFDEMAHPRLRVTVLCLASSFLSSGTLVMSSIGSFLHWRTAAALAAVPSIIHIVIVAFLVHETPVYFVKKGKMKEAEKALSWLWGPRKVKVKQELENLATRLQKHETEDKVDDRHQVACWKILKNKEQYFEAYILKSFLIIHIFNLLQIPGGMGLVTLYTVDILNAVQGSVQVVDGNVATIIISAVKVVFLLLSAYLLYRVGRRPMAVISGIGSALPALATAAILYCQSGGILDLDHGTLAWLNFLLVLLYVASNTLGFYCLTYTMIGELLPAKVRGFLFGYIMALNYLVGGGFAKAYPLMLRAMGMEGLFLMFGLSCVLCTLFVFLLLPETLGRTLEEIEDYFHQPNIMWYNRKRNDGHVS